MYVELLKAIKEQYPELDPDNLRYSFPRCVLLK